MQGKIVKGIGGFYYVHDGWGQVTECKAKGAFRSQSVKPMVGDNVEYVRLDEEAGTGRIERILPRKNALIRPAVSNVDQALILVSAGFPRFHPGLLDRFLIWMGCQSVPVLIGIGKTDTDTDGAWRGIAAVYEGAGYPVCSFSALSGEGLGALRACLAGRTTVLAGASGVGKSTLLNALIPEAAMETGELSARLGRGRHTTRHSEIFFLEENSFLLDTPGFTSLDVPPVEEEELELYFPEFAPYRGQCRFPDCRHLKEPDCAVKRAVEEGHIAPTRYASYCDFRTERSNAKKH